jgi:hypothetical protein
VRTFLTTSRMSPELAARVEASVSGRRFAPGTKRSPRKSALIRVLAVMSVALCVLGVALLRKQEKVRVDAERSTLLERVAVEASRVTSSDQLSLQRSLAWLERAPNAAPDDFVSEELRTPARLTDRLARPTHYVRGTQDELANARRVEQTALTSAPDAFVLCLNDPPAARTEKALLGRVRASYGSRLQAAAGHVHGLRDALVTRPFLQGSWQEQVAQADERRQVERLRRDFERAPFERARSAWVARQLLFVIDEPADTSGPTELDGERPHPVRVGLVDLEADALLLHLRLRVDPRWLSDTARTEHSRGIDSCTLAFEVREKLRATSL